MPSWMLGGNLLSVLQAVRSGVHALSSFKVWLSGSRKGGLGSFLISSFVYVFTVFCGIFYGSAAFLRGSGTQTYRGLNFIMGGTRGVLGRRSGGLWMKIFTGGNTS